MVIVVVDECLEISDLDLFLAVVTFKQRVHLEHHTVIHGGVATCLNPIKVRSMALQKLLYDIVAFQLIMADAQDLEGLLPSNKATLNAEALLSDLLATLVAELFHGTLVTLLF